MTTLYDHQKKALDFCAGRDYYALLMEQGTGKTATVIHDIARTWKDNPNVIVFAPNGVHTNWTLREIPIHLPEDIPVRHAAFYSDPNKKERAALENLFTNTNEKMLRVLTINWESLIHAKGLAAIRQFLETFKRPMVVGDESQRIKTPKAARTKQILRLRKYTSRRVIMSGTAILSSPFDAYSQFGFLHPSILNQPTFASFRAEHAEMLPNDHGLMRHIVERTKGKHIPQLVARDFDGMPKWKNLDRLERTISQHSFRVLKKDCLGLPDKVYNQTFFNMTAKQRRQYIQLRDDLRLQIDDGRIAPVARIAALTKLSQIVSGYFIIPGTNTAERIVEPKDNPKLDALKELIEDAEGQMIIWARFRIEIEDICWLLNKLEIPHVQYHGDVKRTDRPQAIADFESGAARVFVGQQAAGGTGITLIAPNSAADSILNIYYSNTFALEDRLQSEDRSHRIGQEKTALYTDIICPGTIDEKIVMSLRSKVDLAQTVLGDKRRALAMLE
jgi:SNF2 family DNA or RNA helicase